MFCSISKVSKGHRQKLIDSSKLTSFAKSTSQPTIANAQAAQRQRALLSDTEMAGPSHGDAFGNDLTSIAANVNAIDRNSGSLVAGVLKDTWLRGLATPAVLSRSPVIAAASSSKPLSSAINVLLEPDRAALQLQQLVTTAPSSTSYHPKGSKNSAQLISYGASMARESAKREGQIQQLSARTAHSVTTWCTLEDLGIICDEPIGERLQLTMNAAIAATIGTSVDTDLVARIILALQKTCIEANEAAPFHPILEKVCKTASPSAIVCIANTLTASDATISFSSVLADLNMCMAALLRSVGKAPPDDTLGFMHKLIPYICHHVKSSEDMLVYSEQIKECISHCFELIKLHGHSFTTLMFIHDTFSVSLPFLEPTVGQPTPLSLFYYTSLLNAIVALSQRNSTTSVVGTTMVNKDGTDDRHITPEALRVATRIIETIASIHDHSKKSEDPSSTRIMQQCKEALGGGLGLLAKVDPAKVIALRHANQVTYGPFVVESFVAVNDLDGALSALKELGASRPDGWTTPPQTVQTACQRLALSIGRKGSSQHVAAFTSAIYSFKCPHMWIGVFHDYMTVGLALRVRSHAEKCNRSASVILSVDEQEDLKADLEVFIIKMRDMLKALALQRTADCNADPLLELMQECAWHPEKVALLKMLVEYHEHLFVCYPREFQLRALVDIPKEHKSRSKQSQSPLIDRQHNVTTLVGTFLQHAVLCFMRDNRLIGPLKEIAHAWRLPNKDVARLLNRAEDVAPSTQLWECRQCKRLNNARYMYCSCSALRFGSIFCPSCALGQPETNGSCVACGTDFVSKQVSSDCVVPRVPWSCSGCGAANTAYQTIFCHKCKTATGPMADPNKIKKERCGVCSEVNELGFSLYPVCIECGSKSPAFGSVAGSGDKVSLPSTDMSAKAWQCDSCGQWAPTTITRCPHCAYVELRGCSRVRDVAPITCSICGAVNQNGLQSKCEECNSELEGNLPTIVDVCTECFASNTHGASACTSCDAIFSTDEVATRSSRISVKAYYRFCASCQRSVSPYNLSCVCDMCDAYLPYYTTPDGSPIVSVAPNAVGIVATCETILRRLDKEQETVLVPVVEGFLMELTTSTQEAIHVARPLLTDVVIHLGQFFNLHSLSGCRGLALTLALAHRCGCEITEGKLVELDAKVKQEMSKWEHKPSWIKMDESMNSIASYVAGTSSSASAHNTASLLFSAAVLLQAPTEKCTSAQQSSIQDDLTSTTQSHGAPIDTLPKQPLCNSCLSPHAESMCRFNPAGWECSECGAKLSNDNGLDGIMCPTCYQVRPELDSCLEVWVCPTCSRCSPDTEYFCIYCNSHKNAAGDTEVIVLPFLPVACGRCGRPHLEAHCPYCTAIPPTRVKNGSGTVTVATDRYVFVQPMGTCGPNHRVFVPIQLSGELFEGQTVSFDAEEGKQGQLKATRIEVVSDDI